MNWNEKYSVIQHTRTSHVMRRTFSWLIVKGFHLYLQNGKVLKEYMDTRILEEYIPPLREGADQIDPLEGKVPQL